MSKVKCVEGIPKSKLIRRNRRTETRNKKAERKHKSEYYYCYYMQNARYTNVYNTSIIPEKAVVYLDCELARVPVYNNITKSLTIKEQLIPVYKTKIIPEHEIRYRSGREITNIDPILRKVDMKSTKKTYRKIASKQLRRKLNYIDLNKIDIEDIDAININNGSTYKKDYDIAWNIY